MTMMNKLELAYAIALVAHKGQVDKAGVDYINHPLTVSINCKNEKEKIVALLHDVLEDTKVTKEDLLLFFCDEIVDAICLLTHNENDTYVDYLTKIKDNPLARAVKIQDLKHNMDLSRLANPTKKDYERIKNKYEPALKFLTD